MIASKRTNGFTLIEMLIAMTLLSIMVVLLFGSLKIAAESWNAGEGKVVEVNRKAVVYQFFKRHLTTIRPALAQPAQQDAGIGTPIVEQVFQGRSQTLRFVASLPASAARKGLQVFEIATDPGESSTIMVALSPYLQTGPSKPERVVLLEHVKAFAFSYFGKKNEADTANWQADWTGAEHLPSLIKVSISLDDGSYWPDMVFPLKIAGLVSSDTVAADSNEAAAP